MHNFVSSLETGTYQIYVLCFFGFVRLNQDNNVITQNNTVNILSSSYLYIVTSSSRFSILGLGHLKTSLAEAYQTMSKMPTVFKLLDLMVTLLWGLDFIVYYSGHQLISV